MHRRAPEWPRRVLLIVIALATVIVSPLVAHAQADQGRISGTVTDANGGLVPGATIIVKNDRTG